MDSDMKTIKSHFFASVSPPKKNPPKPVWNLCSVSKPAWILAARNGSPFVRTLCAGAKKGAKCHSDGGVDVGFRCVLVCPWALSVASRTHLERFETGGAVWGGESDAMPS